jgi:hypothetical protein
MYENNGFDQNHLLVQLQNFKLILQVNSELLENNQDLRELISQAMVMLESHLNELDKWGRNDPTHYNTSLDQANKILEEIKFLIGRMLNQDTLPHNDSLQNPADSLGSFYNQEDETDFLSS